jgi:hypothetical protein
MTRFVVSEAKQLMPEKLYKILSKFFYWDGTYMKIYEEDMGLFAFLGDLATGKIDINEVYDEDIEEMVLKYQNEYRLQEY